MNTLKSAAEWDAQEREILEMIRRSDAEMANERHNRRVLLAAVILAGLGPAYGLVSLVSQDWVPVPSAPVQIQKALTPASRSGGCPSQMGLQ
ncbi:hypothetical protein [Xylophilus sp. GOD-11R]|uniref:hypothetical protein n=1 Tax=Xylophilus sp. GOD-11R TaxID=3089814 RepID=UPI00298C7AD8|nr:hypothetical protein [Xylophilus sp. GOD-11R]WPB57374.1 hypothetical protein R9X41_01595 [Xylophilus sp. GOD-11R]